MMGRLLEKRWVCILLSAVLAITFWVYVRVTVDPDGVLTVHNVRVELTGTSVLASQSLTIAGISPQVVELQVEAPTSVRTELLRYHSGLYVQVDISRCVEGENTVRGKVIWPDNFNEDGVSNHRLEPPTVTVTVEKLYSQTFPVEFQLDGRVAKDYQMGTPAVEPESVTVSGPVEQVNQIAKVAAVLEDSQLDERFAGDLPLRLLDQEGNLLTGLEVTLSAETAYVVVPVVVTREVALTVDIKPGGGATEENARRVIDPPTIIVSGSEADMAGLEEISLGSVDLADVVTTKAFSFPINLDPSLTNESGIASAAVTVTVEGLSTRTFYVDNITTTPPPNGYQANVVTQSVPVTVRGREEDLEAIDASQLRVVAGLPETVTLGASRVQAKVYLNGTSTVGVIGEYTVAVNISE